MPSTNSTRAKVRPVNPRPCAQCGEVYQPVDNQPSRKYCSKACADQGRSKQVEKTCEGCGETFMAKASEIKRRGAKYCSRACWREHGAGHEPEFYQRLGDRLSVERRGENNPAYKHGKHGNRARLSSFSLTLKGEDCCRNCGGTNRLQLHHIIPRSMSKAARDEIRNGVPLCVHCHMSWHRRGKITIYRDIFTPDEWEYVSSVELLGQNTSAWLDDRYPPRPEEESPCAASASTSTLSAMGSSEPVESTFAT